MSVKKKPEFTRLRGMFWPIHSVELKKFIPLSLIMFGLLFIYTVTRDTKDTLIINAVGVRIIPFLQGTVLTITGFLFVLLYAKLTNKFSREKIFYIIITPFLVFYALFGFVIHPHSDWFHPAKETIQMLGSSFPMFSSFIDIYGCWSYSLFYVLTEIWGNAMIGLLFWEFTNHIVLIKESKRFYGLFAIIGNIALIISGYFVYFCSHSIQSIVLNGKDSWTLSIYLLMGSVVIMGVFVVGIFRWMHTNVLQETTEDASKKPLPQKKSLFDSALFILRSPEILLILVLVLSYSITINLLEVQWKHQLSLFCDGDRGIYNGYMGLYSLVTGIFTIAFGLIISTHLLHSGSWFRAAIITPLLFLIAGGFYFMHIINPNMLHFISFKMSPLAFSAAIGGFIIILLKSLKYTLFEPTKEMAYIPLDEELRTKGKAAVDVLGNNIGEASSGYIQIILFTIIATKDTVILAPYACGVFVVFCFTWLCAVKIMSRKII